MSLAEEDEFEWVESRPDVEFYFDNDERGRKLLVAHEFLNPFGWAASDHFVEVRR